ncbi:MAG: phosphodiesterase [Gammaproteobacteria bacterium]|nr:phosphodiesterase [Gammaproteobacteria bacterium]
MTVPATSSVESVRVLHLTDPHLFADIDGEFRGTVTYASLVSVLAHYQNSGWNADIVSVTGDLIQDDSSEAYENFKALFRPLRLPIHCVPGNHDDRTLMSGALDAAPFYYCGTAEFDNWLIAGVDSCLNESAGGVISADELDRLDTAIESSDAKHVMVCLHHPPVPMGSKWLDTVGLNNGHEFLARIGTSGRVRLAIFGHVHQAYDKAHDGVQIIGTPSTCRQFKPLSDDFAVDGQPPAYRRLTLHADGSFDNELVWTRDA